MIEMKSSISLGSDPEFFLEDQGKIISSIGKIGGSKDNHKKITDRCNVHEDNVAMELTFLESYSPAEFTATILGSISDAKKYVKEKGFSISKKSSHVFSKSQLRSNKSKEFGCSPDINAFTREKNLSPPSDTMLRSCGGHVSVGYMSPSEDMNYRIGLLMDIFLGVPSVILDKDNRRREIYGKASAIRHKDFGVEYRTLSNFWVFKSSYIKWVFATAVKCVEIAHSGADVDNSVIERAINIINSCNRDQALKFVNQFNIKLP